MDIGNQWKWRDFQIIENLYKCRAGAVYKVRLKSNARAIYVLKERRNAELGKEKDILNEVRLFERTNHVNIIKCFGSFWEPQRKSLILVLEYANAGDLASLIQSQQQPPKSFLSYPFLLQLTLELCQAIHHLHERGIIHRDIKSQNIFLKQLKNAPEESPQVMVKLGDLGVSRALARPDEMLQSFYGTPLYASPQVFLHEQYSQKTDIWSLGVVLYELAQLQVPFLGDNMLHLADNIVRGHYLELKPGLPYPAEFCTLIHRMLSPAEHTRPSMSEILPHVQQLMTRSRHLVDSSSPSQSKVKSNSNYDQLDNLRQELQLMEVAVVKKTPDEKEKKHPHKSVDELRHQVEAFEAAYTNAGDTDDEAEEEKRSEPHVHQDKPPKLVQAGTEKSKRDQRYEQRLKERQERGCSIPGHSVTSPVKPKTKQDQVSRDTSAVALDNNVPPAQNISQRNRRYQLRFQQYQQRRKITPQPQEEEEEAPQVERSPVRASPILDQYQQRRQIKPQPQEEEEAPQVERSPVRAFPILDAKEQVYRSPSPIHGSFVNNEHHDHSKARKKKNRDWLFLPIDSSVTRASGKVGSSASSFERNRRYEARSIERQQHQPLNQSPLKNSTSAQNFGGHRSEEDHRVESQILDKLRLAPASPSKRNERYQERLAAYRKRHTHDQSPERAIIRPGFTSEPRKEYQTPYDSLPRKEPKALKTSSQDQSSPKRKACAWSISMIEEPQLDAAPQQQLARNKSPQRKFNFITGSWVSYH